MKLAVSGYGSFTGRTRSLQLVKVTPWRLHCLTPTGTPVRFNRRNGVEVLPYRSGEFRRASGWFVPWKELERIEQTQKSPNLPK